MTKNNLELWSKVEKTDPKHTKLAGYGTRKFTSINAQYQLRQATEQWGSYGDTWGIKDIKYQFLSDLPHNQVMALAYVVFYYPGGEFPISSTIMVVSYSVKNSSNRVDDEWAKKVETDVTTKALSKLGFSADVFLGRYDDNRYVNSLKEEFASKEPAKLKEFNKKAYDYALEAIASGEVDRITSLREYLPMCEDGELKAEINKMLQS